MSLRRTVLVASWLAVAAVPAIASRTYTPEQLRQMVGSGRFPEQASPTTQKQAMAFASCVLKVREVVDAVGGNYPTKTIVDSGVAYMVKVWANDAALTLTCSQPDLTLVMTRAAYR